MALTQNQKLWEQEVKRIERFVKRHSKEGYIFPENLIPSKPARITKRDISMLKSLKGMNLYSQATYTLSKGVEISGAEAHAAELATQRRKYAQAKQAKGVDYKPPTQVNVTLNAIQEIINKWSPDPRWSDTFSKIKEQDTSRAQNILNGAINELGAEQVAKNIELNADRIHDLIWSICYGESGSGKDGGDRMQAQLVEFSAILRGRALTMEESQFLTDLAETQTR